MSDKLTVGQITFKTDTYCDFKNKKIIMDSGFSNSINDTTRMIIDTQEQGMRHGLKKLGWISPEEFEDIKTKIECMKMVDSNMPKSSSMTYYHNGAINDVLKLLNTRANEQKGELT